MTATDILHALAQAGSAEATATLIEQTMKTELTLLDLIHKTDKAKSKSARSRCLNRYTAACAERRLNPAWLLARVTSSQVQGTPMPVEALP